MVLLHSIKTFIELIDSTLCAPSLWIVVLPGYFIYNSAFCVLGWNVQLRFTKILSSLGGDLTLL
jgi:hypothetical protein